MSDFNTHLSFASFAMAGLIVIAITFHIPRPEVVVIASAIVGYVLAALVFELVKEKWR